MSIDVLQNRIRKFKNPSALILAPVYDFLPEGYDKTASGVGDYCEGLLNTLKDIVPAIRVDFASFALLGGDGSGQLHRVMHRAKELGYYVILDWMMLEKPGAAADRATQLLTGDTFACDGLTLCPYAGTDCIKPYVQAAAQGKKDLFVAIKTANKSGRELQDLQTGGRLVHMAAADYLSPWTESAIERCGYSRVSAMVGANSATMLRTIRKKYPNLFLLVDGLDVSGANARNASCGFDSLGHGALCCAGSSIMGAWKEHPELSPLEAAVESAERMKRNITRYVTIL